MNVVDERNQWRKSFEEGEWLNDKILEDYRLNRDNDTWRLSRNVERLCEYILYLENK